MTAAGKINASNVNETHRIIVKVSENGTVRPSDTKTGEGVQVARVIGKGFRAAGAYEARGKYIVETSAGSFEAAPIQTMWLAPEDNAGIKRAHVEALEEDKRQNRAATPAEVQAAEDTDLVEVARVTVAAARQATTAAEAERIMTEGLGLEPGTAAQWVAVNIPELAAQEAEEAPVVETPATARALQVQAAGRVLRMPELTFVLPLLPAGRELVRVSDLRELVPAELLTLHSQDGKVDNMNNASETQTTPATERHTGSSVVKLIERVWDRIRADHPELPEVVVTTGSGEGVKWGHFRPESWKLADEEGRLHEFFLASEAFAKGATQVLQTTIHEAVHTLNRTRKIQDTSRQGRWHNAAFRKTAEELGLEHPAAQADKSHGFSFVKLTEATKVKYADLLAELDSELKLTGLLPFWMGGKDEEDQGGEKITGKPKKTEGEEGETKSGPVKAVCDCEEPVIIRISQKVMDMGVVRCDGCESLFHRP